MVSEGAPAAELLGPCGRLEGSRGAARATRVGRRGRRLLQALPARARTVPRDPRGGGSSGNRRRRLRHPRVLGDGAPASGEAPGAPRLSRAPGSERAQRRKPHPGSSRLGVPNARRRCGPARGPDGGAGAGRVLTPREMPSGARCRLYLRSRLTSAARVPRARAPPAPVPAALRRLPGRRPRQPIAAGCRRALRSRPMGAQINHLKQPIVRRPQSEGGDLDRERRGRDGPIKGERRREGGPWAARLTGL